VRLGENDLTKDPDCDTCPPVIDYGIEKKHVHPENTNFNHDIALIRLDKNVNLTGSKFVGSICLPLEKKDFFNLDDHETFLVMGFGRTENNKSSEIMLDTKVKHVSKDQCESVYKSGHGRGTPVKDFHLCAGGGESDSCRGFSLFNLVFNCNDSNNNFRRQRFTFN
jgi:Trypsin